jgi:hypothetical protein
MDAHKSDVPLFPPESGGKLGFEFVSRFSASYCRMKPEMNKVTNEGSELIRPYFPPQGEFF